MTNAYDRAGYSRIPIEFGQRPAVLAVDFQASHIDPRHPFGGRPLALRALENSIDVVKAARANGIPVAVCYTEYHHRDEMPYWSLATVDQDNSDGNLRGSPASVLDPRITDRDYDHVVRKTGPSMFYETTVQMFLTKNQVDTVIVTGVNTSGCIRATVIDSFQRGYRTVVPEDCVGDLEQQEHDDNIRDMRRRYSRISSAAEVIDYLKRCKRS